MTTSFYESDGAGRVARSTLGNNTVDARRQISAAEVHTLKGPDGLAAAIQNSGVLKYAMAPQIEHGEADCGA